MVSLSLSLGAFVPVHAAGNCSPYLGLSSLNEFFKDRTNQANDPDDFIEVKLLDQSIPFGTFSQWSIQVCEDNEPGNSNDDDGCSAKINLSSFTDTTPPWMLLKDGSIGDFYNFKTGFDAILLDANDDVIDYLSVDGHTQLEQSGCTGAALPYDYQASSPGASDKFIFRSPDGTGNWDSAQSASENPTEDESNDDDPAVPVLTFTEPTITQGTTTASVTLTLSFAASDIISVDFYTFDGSLLAGTDYTALSTTRSFAVGQTSLTIDVPVDASSNLGEFNFFVGINTVTPGLASIAFNVGQITVIGASIDHFNIDVGSGSANTCNPFSFSVTAEDSSNNPVVGYSGTIVITTSTGNGNFSTVSATNNINPDPDNDDNGSASYTFDALDNGVVTLALANEHAETLILTVSDLAIPVSSVSTNIVFRDNAFTITDTDALVAGDDIPVAGRNHSYQIQMIRKDPVNGCGVASGYSGNKALKMWRIKNPVDPSPNDPVFAGTILPSIEPVAANGNIVFTGGIADVLLATSDIGKFTIELADISNTFAEITIRGASNEQTVRPFGLAVTAIEAGPAPATANPGGSAPGDAIFTSAGSDFSATVAGVLWELSDDSEGGLGDGIIDANQSFNDNAVAPSFDYETVLSPAVAGFTPATGTIGSLANATILTGEFTNGVETVTDLQYDEVGSFTLETSVTDYLGTPGANVTGDNDIVIGRFIPATFRVDLVPGGDGVLANTCGVLFTYIGESFDYDTAPVFQVTALNAQLNPTGNYRDAFAKLNANSITVDVTQDDTNLLVVSYTQAPMTPIPANDNTGIVDYTFGADTYRYGPATPVSFAKFPNSQIRFFTADINPEITTVDDGEVPAVTVSETLDTTGNDQRFGRLRMSNAHGSELNDLTMPAFTEYWDGTGWIRNIEDNCTAIANTDLEEIVSNPAGLSVPFVANQPNAILGDVNLTYPFPGAGNDGFVDTRIRLDTASHLWLRHNWNGGPDFEDDPTARATFGIYEGDPVQIYIQQIYPQ